MSLSEGVQRLVLSNDKLRYIKNFKSLSEQTLIPMAQCQTGSCWGALLKDYTEKCGSKERKCFDGLQLKAQLACCDWLPLGFNLVALRHMQAQTSVHFHSGLRATSAQGPPCLIYCPGQAFSGWASTLTGKDSSTTTEATCKQLSRTYALWA